MIEYPAFAASIMSPARPESAKLFTWAKQRFPEIVRQDYLSQSKLKEAWESFISEGLLPLDWASRETPRKISQMCLLALDVKGITTAEALAREAITRFEPWGAPQPEKIIWRFASADRESNGTIRPAHTAPWFVLFEALRRNGLYPASIIHQREMHERRTKIRANTKSKWEAAISTAIQETNMYEGWRYAASEGWSVPELGAKKAPVGALYRDLRSPMEPLISIWSLGYMLLSITEEAANILIQ